MEKERFPRENPETSSASDNKSERRLKRVPLFAVPKNETQSSGRRVPDSFNDVLARMLATREEPEPIGAHLTVVTAESKKKKKKKKTLTVESDTKEVTSSVRDEGVPKPTQYEPLRLVTTPERQEDEEDDEEKDKESTGNYPLLHELVLPEGAVNGGEVIYLRDFVEQKEATKNKGEKPVTTEEDAESKSETPLAEVLPFGREHELQPSTPAESPQVERLAEETQPPTPGGGNGGELPPSNGNALPPIGRMSPPGMPEFDNALPVDAVESPMVPIAPNAEPTVPIIDQSEVLPPVATNANQTPFYRTPEPAEVFREYAQRDGAEMMTGGGALPPTENMISAREAVFDADYAERSGWRRGFFMGALAGGAYEHFKHRRREKKAANQAEAQTRELNRTQDDQRLRQRFERVDQMKRQTEHDRRIAAAETRTRAAEKQLAEQRQDMNRVVREPQAEEQLVIPPEHVIQSSSWHRIEVDARTGRPVEMPTFKYGQEYYRERAAESTPIAKRNAAAGEVALVAAATVSAQGSGQAGTQANDSTSSQPGTSTLPPPYVPNASMQGSPSRKSTNSTVSHAPVWPYMVALLAIAICIVWLLH